MRGYEDFGESPFQRRIRLRQIVLRGGPPSAREIFYAEQRADLLEVQAVRVHGHGLAEIEVLGVDDSAVGEIGDYRLALDGA